MKLNDIRQELNQVKNYFCHKQEYDGYFAKGEMLYMRDLVQKYEKEILKAPINLYKVYIAIYHDGLTGENAAERLDVTVRSIYRLNVKIFQFFQKVL